MSHSFFVVERADGSRAESIERLAVNPRCEVSEICRSNILELCDVIASDHDIRNLSDLAAFRVNSTDELLFLRENPLPGPRTGFQSMCDIE